MAWSEVPCPRKQCNHRAKERASDLTIIHLTSQKEHNLNNRLFAADDHMVQKPPYWGANWALGHIKQRKFKFSCFVLDVPVHNLLSSMVVFTRGYIHQF